MAADGPEYLNTLRKRAEALIAPRAPGAPPAPTVELRRLAHDLAVHQVELEIQNEELQAAYQHADSILARYAQLYHKAPVGFLTLDENGVILQANQTFVDMMGTPDEDPAGLSLASLVESPGREILLARYRAIFHAPENKVLEARMIRTGQDSLDIRLTGRLVTEGMIQGRSGTQAGCLLLAVNDVTAEKAAENALERLNQLYDVLSRLGISLSRMNTREGLLKDACTILAEFGKFRLVSVAWLEAGTGKVLPLAMAGEGLASMDGIPVPADPGPEDRSPLATCIRENRIIVCQDLQADPRPLSWGAGWVAENLRGLAAVPIHMGGEVAGALLIHSDRQGAFQGREAALMEEVAAVISFGLDHQKALEERAKLEAQIQRAQKMESLGMLASGVAHDMNNVLAAILSLASVQLHVQAEGSPTYSTFETIRDAATRGADMVKRLLAFSRQTPSEMHELDLNALLREEANLLERTSLAKVRLELDLAMDLHLIRGDGSALAHALMNLSINAMDAMEGGGTLTFRTCNLGQDQIEVSVEDNGSGMTREVLDRAIDPFFTTKGVGKGTGLGLSLVFTTVSAHGGQLRIQSEPGLGTRVSMTFPATVAHGPEPGQDHPLREPLRGQSLQVLLVDDDDLVQKSTRMLLEVLGHQVTSAVSGEAALAFLERGFWPDAVILDVNMPGLGGKATLAALRGLHPAVPVLLATGRADQEALDLIAAHPFVTLLPKPFTFEELRDRLHVIV